MRFDDGAVTSVVHAIDLGTGAIVFSGPGHESSVKAFVDTYNSAEITMVSGFSNVLAVHQLGPLAAPGVAVTTLPPGQTMAPRTTPSPFDTPAPPTTGNSDSNGYGNGNGNGQQGGAAGDAAAAETTRNIGIGVGGAVLLIAIVGVVAFLMLRKKSPSSDGTSSDPFAETEMAQPMMSAPTLAAQQHQPQYDPFAQTPSRPQYGQYSANISQQDADLL